MNIRNYFYGVKETEEKFTVKSIVLIVNYVFSLTQYLIKLKNNLILSIIKQLLEFVLEMSVYFSISMFWGFL